MSSPTLSSVRRASVHEQDVTVNGCVPVAPPSLTTCTWYVAVAVRPCGTVTDIDVLLPPLTDALNVPPVPEKKTWVLRELGGEPKLVPVRVTIVPHAPDCGLTPVNVGCCGTGVSVAAPAVLQLVV